MKKKKHAKKQVKKHKKKKSGEFFSTFFMLVVGVGLVGWTLVKAPSFVSSRYPASNVSVTIEK